MAGAGMKDIKRRIKSVESTRQITKAMELVSSSKMRRAKAKAEISRPMFNILEDTLNDIKSKNKEMSSTYTIPREVKTTGIVVVAGDRGLAGGYNSNLFKTVQSTIDSLSSTVSILPVGKKATEYFAKRGYDIINRGYGLVENVKIGDVFFMTKQLCRLFKSAKLDEIYVAYTHFTSALTQTPILLKLLPLEMVRTRKSDTPLTDVVFEGAPVEVFDKLVPQYLVGVVNSAIAESFASEQAARRAAMESASDNADEMIENLELKYNRARQGAITQEISEIVGGSEALK